MTSALSIVLSRTREILVFMHVSRAKKGLEVLTMRWAWPVIIVARLVARVTHKISLRPSSAQSSV